MTSYVEVEGDWTIKSGCRFTERGIEIYDVAKDEWEPMASAYEWVNKRTKPAKENNKTMEYKVKTDLLHSYDLNEQISEGERDALLKEGCSESWFDPVDQVQEGQYWKDNNGTILRIQQPLGKDHFVGLDIRTDEELNIKKSLLTTVGRVLYKDEIEQAIKKEAKRRGFENGTRIRSWVDGDDSFVTIGDVGFDYEEHSDQLSLGHTWIYKQGEFAEIVDQTPTIKINGNKVEFNDHPKVGCTTIKKEVFIEQAKTIARHGVRIHRKGEDITDQILAIASHYGYETDSGAIFDGVTIRGTLEDVTFSSENVWGNND